MRVIVTGARDINQAQAEFVWATLYRAFLPLAREGAEITLAQGEADGVDAVAKQWGEATAGVEIEMWPARWKELGKQAGPARNAEMVAPGADLCMAFPGRKSVGTWDCLKKAATAGIPGRVYPLPD